MFFNICNKCKKTFTSEAEYIKHTQSHKAEKKAYEKKEIDLLKAEENIAPPVEKNEDKIIETNREVNNMKKKLIAAGIEAATMTPAQVRARYEEEFKNGNVR